MLRRHHSVFLQHTSTSCGSAVFGEPARPRLTLVTSRLEHRRKWGAAWLRHMWVTPLLCACFLL